MVAEEGGLPLVKVLELASEKGSTNSKYQAKHLSFQEGLFADALIKGTVEMPSALKDLDLVQLLRESWFLNSSRAEHAARGCVLAPPSGRLAPPGGRLAE